jgi:mRNA-degrading endonuclease RelE of RelBE toxin-antitoxin system
VKVVLTREAARQFDELPLVIAARVRRLFIRLSSWPNVSGARALRGPLAGHFRMRTGDYRVQFRSEGESIIVVRVGHRARFYDD